MRSTTTASAAAFWLGLALAACGPSPSVTARTDAASAVAVAAAPAPVGTTASAARGGAASATAFGPAMVEVLPAGAGLSYALSAGACTAEHRCPASIELRDGTRRLDGIALAFAPSTNQFTRQPPEPGAPASAPARWSAGSEEGSVTLTLQAVRLASSQSAASIAVLVRQEGGFEHLKRRYDLLAHDGTKLRVLWSAEEPPGPAWSEATVAAGADGDEIVLMEGFRPGGNTADRLGGRRIAWSAAQQRVTERPLGPLPALVTGEFTSVAAARRVVEAQPCLAGHWLVPATQVGGPAGRYALARVAANPADLATRPDAACPADIRSRAATFRTTPSSQGRK